MTSDTCGILCQMLGDLPVLFNLPSDPIVQLSVHFMGKFTEGHRGLHAESRSNLHSAAGTKMFKTLCPLATGFP